MILVFEKKNEKKKDVWKSGGWVVVVTLDHPLHTPLLVHNKPCLNMH